MLILADNDVIGAVAAIRRILTSSEWREFTTELNVLFETFAGLGLAPDSSDQVVWEIAQANAAVLITGNRAGGYDSLDRVIREFGSPDSLPVLTIANAQRTVRDSSYAERCAITLLDFLEIIEQLRGTGRLFIPKATDHRQS